MKPQARWFFFICICTWWCNCKLCRILWWHYCPQWLFLRRFVHLSSSSQPRPRQWFCTKDRDNFWVHSNLLIRIFYANLLGESLDSFSDNVDSSVIWCVQFEDSLFIKFWAELLLNRTRKALCSKQWLPMFYPFLQDRKITSVGASLLEWITFPVFNTFFKDEVTSYWYDNSSSLLGRLRSFKKLLFLNPGNEGRLFLCVFDFHFFILRFCFHVEKLFHHFWHFYKTISYNMALFT